MKVLISAYACNPQKGGEDSNGWNLAYQVAKSGHEVWCLTASFSRENILQKIEQVNLPNLKFIYVDVPRWVHRMYYYQVGVYYHYLVWQNRAYKIAKELHQEHTFDIVHHITLASPQLGTGLWKLPIPFMYGPLGGGQFPPRPFKRFFYNWWRMEILRYWTSHFMLKFHKNTYKAIQKSELIYVTNDETNQLIRKHGGEQVEYFLDTSLPEEFFPNSYPEREPQKKLKILWVGRLFARKGLPLVLEALGKLDPSIPFTFTIVGDGPMRNFVPKWIRENGLESKVDWRGRLPWQEVKKVYLNHDIFMFCSLRDSFGSQLLEAMAYGLPIITLNHQGARVFVPEEASIKVDVVDVNKTLEELKDAVTYIHQNPEERRRMGKAAYDFAITQTWAHKVQKVLKAYKALTESQSQEEKLV